MLNKNASCKALKRLFRRFSFVDLSTLYKTLKTRSRMSVFRRLIVLDYLSSFTHRGRYYTQSGIPQFDEYGLWFQQGVGFSRLGTLKATIVDLIENAVAGFTHKELELLLHTKVHNTLLILVRDKRIVRKHVEGMFLYVSLDSERKDQQIAKRQEQLMNVQVYAEYLSAPMIIDVLAEALQAKAVPALISKRLALRGISISIEQVEQVFLQYGINAEKKTKE